MSRKIPVVCESCDAQFKAARYEEEARCPACGYVNDILNDGFDDRRREDDCE
jgi:predicted RNA-binding Zn-ribbon protein involved in translation (DUF1610 family)